MSWKTLLALVACTKAATYGLIYMSYQLLPFNVARFRLNFIDPSLLPIDNASVFESWDAQHYVYLAGHGFQTGHLSNAFSPLLPLLMKTVGLFLGGNLVDVWPLFIALAWLFRDPRPEGLRWGLLYASTTLQGAFIVMHALDYWVA